MSRGSQRNYVRVLVSCVALTSCAVGPGYHRPADRALGLPQQFVGQQHLGAQDNLASWWSQFSDPVLTSLISKAAADNLDIAQAAARLTQAHELLVQARASQVPSVSANGSVGRSVNAGFADSTSFSLGVQPSWTADLFGGLRRSKEASRANYEAAGFSIANVQTAVAAEIARNYVEVRGLNLRLAIARDTLKTQDDNVRIAGWRAQAGLVSSIDVEQARAQRAAIAASIPAFEQAQASARFRIAVLTGQAPGAVDELLGTSDAIPVAPSDVATGIPSDILRQRPDIRIAERNLASSSAQIGVAQAQLYPALTISGNFAATSTSLRTLTDFVTGSVFVSVAQTIFDGGRLRSVIRQRRAAEEESLAAYKSTVLRALEDVDNAIVALTTAKARVVAFTEQVEAANAAAIYARSNYRGGLTDFRTLLSAEQSLLSARDGVAAAKADISTATIQLYLSLGGGWTPSTETHF